MEEISLRETSKRAVALAESPALAWTSELRWWDSKAEDAPICAIAGSPHLGLLSRLTLDHLRFTDAALTALAKSHGLPRLRVLALSNCNWQGKFTAKGIQHILDSDRLPALSELRLSEGAPYGLDRVDLARSSGLARITRLKLSGGWADPVSLVALADNPAVAGLDYLDLYDTDIDETAALKLAESPYLSGLESLDLTESNNYSGERLPASAVSRLRKRFGTVLKFSHGTLALD